MVRIRVGGRWLHTFTQVSDVRYRHGADGGCLEASWAISQRPSALAHPTLTRGRVVEIFKGAQRVWVGRLSEDGAGSSECHAVGFIDDTRRLLATTPNLNNDIQTAVANGAGFTYTPGSAPPAQPTDTPGGYLHEAITTAATADSKRATVRADGALRFEADPTVPEFYVTPGAGVIGRADEDYMTHVTVLYVSSVSGTPPVADGTLMVTASDPDAAALHGRSDYFIDLRPRGLHTEAEALKVAQGVLNKGGARLSFAGSITLTADQLRTAGGQRVSLAEMRAGQMVRFMGVQTPERVARASFDIIVGSTDHTVGSGQITLSPLGLAPRNLADIIASVPSRFTSLNPNPGAGATAS